MAMVAEVFRVVASLHLLGGEKGSTRNTSTFAGYIYW